MYGNNLIKALPYVLTRIFLLLFVFILTLYILWYPLIHAMSLTKAVEAIFTRIFPIRRGIFEDKVASFWCVLHNFYKVNSLWDRSKQVAITTIVTLGLCIPSCVLLLKKPSNFMFILTLFTVSMIFFLFSF
jgi:alpha-1,3-glucosyltransferase